jgi:hypothetical protein
MNELKNYAELEFSNPILIDVFGNYMPNSVLAEVVDESGIIKLKLAVNPPVEIPKNCEDIIGLLFGMLENNPDASIGKAYSEKKTEILQETVYRLSKVLDGFSSVKLVLETTAASVENPDAEVTTHTEFTLNRTKTGGVSK